MSTKRILVAPLDWGLGHASRCIPVIHSLLDKKMEVIIAADGRPLEFLRIEFPQLKTIRLRGYDIVYPLKGKLALHMLLQVPKIVYRIVEEHRKLKKLIEDLKIDLVISDNRYGLWSDRIPSVFITHQLYIRTPVGAALLRYLVRKIIPRYSECWVPDDEGPGNLSGELSHLLPVKERIFFIGPLSRFTNVKNTTTEPKYDILVLLSGPEPQRGAFEKLILSQLNGSSLRCLVVQGITEKSGRTEHAGNTEIVSFLDTKKLLAAMQNSEVVVCRPGYSSIMDLSVTGKKAIFVPTPGQTEQEYLAVKFMQEQTAYTMKQKDFDLQLALKETNRYKGFKPHPADSSLLEKRLRRFL